MRSLPLEQNFALMDKNCIQGLLVGRGGNEHQTPTAKRKQSGKCSWVKGMRLSLMREVQERDLRGHADTETMAMGYRMCHGQ